MAEQQTSGAPQGAALWATFQLDNEDYCVPTSHVVAMTIPESIKSMPNNADHMLGVMQWVGQSLPIVDMRRLFGLPTMEESIAEFTTMRQMHLDWIEALEDTVENNKPFEKAIDPHKCMFGKWYDNYTTDNISMRFILSKIGPPHEYIHTHGAEVKACMSRGDISGAKEKYLEAYETCTKQVLPLLDQLIETYKEANRGIVIVVQHEGRPLGLLVDEMNALIPAAKAAVHPIPAAVGRNKYIDSLIVAGDRTYAALNVPALSEFVDSEQAQAKQEAERQAMLEGYRGNKS